MQKERKKGVLREVETLAGLLSELSHPSFRSVLSLTTEPDRPKSWVRAFKNCFSSGKNGEAQSDHRETSNGSSSQLTQERQMRVQKGDRMHENSIRFPRLAQLEQWQSENCSTLKPQYSSISIYRWNTGTVQIRYCDSENKNSRGFSHVFSNRGYVVPTVPLFHRQFSLLQSFGFGVEQFLTRHCSSCSNISWVIV